MTDIVVRHFSEVPSYQGPHAIPGIRFHGMRGALGVSAWGMNVLELAPHSTGYPEHDHTQDGQEEVYVVLEGTAFLTVDGAETRVPAGTFVRVPPQLKRKFVTKADGAVLLALGGTPGKAYDVSKALG